MDNLKIALFTMIGVLILLSVFVFIAPDEARGPASADPYYNVDYNPLGDPSA